jgi:hypothetical protein
VLNFVEDLTLSDMRSAIAWPQTSHNTEEFDFLYDLSENNQKLDKLDLEIDRQILVNGSFIRSFY